MSEKTHVDPSALGLFGLAMVTLVAASQKLGITNGISYVLPWAVFLGALAQLAAGALDYKKKNVFGATAFCAYGFFWLGMALSWLIGAGVLGELPSAEKIARLRQYMADRDTLDGRDGKPQELDIRKLPPAKKL